MKRNEWTFNFTGAKLGEAAKKKRLHHDARLRFWTEAKDKVIAEIRDSGIEVNESMAGSNYSKGGFSPQVMVRNDLQLKLTECHNKINEHRSKINEYDGWVQVFSVNMDASLPLHADDYLYFFGE